jgi:hypothetical protein
MSYASITLSGERLQDTRELNIQISLMATLNVDAKEARRRATDWLISEVGNMLIGGVPQLVICQRTVWRVPALLTSSQAGTLGQVGEIDVDTASGEMLVSDELRERILTNVESLACPT